MKTSAENLDKMLEQLLNVVRIRRDKVDSEKIEFDEFLSKVFDGLNSITDFNTVEKNFH